MGSLSKCLKNAGLSEHENAILRGAVKDNRDSGDEEHEAAVKAVLDHVESLLAERKDIVDQIDKLGGEAPKLDFDMDAAKKIVYGDEDPLNNRDVFSFERVVDNGSRVEMLSFRRGEEVKVAGRFPMTVGKITGISHANRQIKVGSVWHDNGYIYKKDYDELATPRAEIEKDLSRLEDRIKDGNTIEYQQLVEPIQKNVKKFGLDAEFNERIDDLYKAKVRLEMFAERQREEKRQAEEEAKEAKAEQDRIERENAKPVDPVKMTMAEWKKTSKDYKTILDGTRMVLRPGGMVAVEIVKDDSAQKEGDVSESVLDAPVEKLRKRLDDLLAKRERWNEEHMRKYRNDSATRAQTTTHNARISDLNEQIKEIRDAIKASPAEEESGDQQAKIPPLTIEKGEVAMEPTWDSFADFWNGLLDGKGTVDDVKEAFATALDRADEFKASISKLKNDQLKRMLGGWFRPDDRKADLVSKVYDATIRRFVLDKDIPSMQWSHGENFAKVEREHNEKIRGIVNSLTEEDLASFLKAIEDGKKERESALEEQKAAVADPKTLEDFNLYAVTIRNAGKTLAEERKALTPEQRALWDSLAAEKSRTERNNRIGAQKSDVSVAAVTTDGQVIETKHTKTGEPLFVVKAAERVAPDIYKQWNATARRLGGYYSSFRGNGAVPGFQFKTRENADAFLKFLGGDVEEAKAVVQERRDAFADDRSQSAVERLNEMADRLEDSAIEALNRDRKTNTNRRADMAARAESAARSQEALAKTMRNIAGAIESGSAKLLDRVRQKAQVELLQDFIRSAKDDEIRVEYPSYADQERHRGAPATIETAEYAAFPRYTLYRSDLANLGRKLIETDGTKKIGQQILKVADDVTDAYLKFAKDNFDQVAQFRTSEGSRVTFPTRDLAEASIARSGYRGKAIAYQVKRGEHAIIFSPTEAQERGIWPGDGDKKITFTAEFGAELVEKLGKLNRGREKVAVPWQFENTYDRLKKLAGMGIETPAEFRSALREFINLREQPKEEDKIKKLERAMVGRKNDGLDFFPTPEAIAQEMVDAADIKEGMSVLEPSAGMGHIAEVIRGAGVEPDVVEMSNDRKELLEAKGFNVVGRDFMETEGAYDRIVMNPPFGDRRDAQHVQHAYSMLKPGGRLVAIMGEGVFFGQDKKAQAFRDWLDEVGGTSEKLPEGSFLDPSLPVNTGVNARMVVVDKPSTISEVAHDKDYFDRYADRSRDYNSRGVRDGQGHNDLGELRQDDIQSGSLSYLRRVGQRFSTIGNGIAKDFVARGYTKITGRTVKNSHDLAVLAQIYRDPRLETARYFFVKNGEIVGQTGVSSRKPGNSAVLLGDTDYQRQEYLDDLADQAYLLGADSVWFLHNHPSGDPIPSKSDAKVTVEIAGELESRGLKFAGHVIINHNKYSTISIEDGRLTGDYTMFDFGEDAQYDINNPKQPHPLLGEKIDGPEQLAEVAKKAQVSKGQIVIIGVSGSSGVRVISEVTPDQLKGMKGAAILRRIAKQTGSDRLFAYGISSGMADSATEAIKNGLLVDAIIVDNGEEFSVVGESGARPKEGISLGSFDTGYQVSMPTAGKDTITVDGVVLEFNDETAEVVAFSPEQVKSAVGNNGDFDSDSSNILRSIGGQSTNETPSSIRAELVGEFGEKGIASLEDSGLLQIIPISDAPSFLELSGTEEGAYDASTGKAYLFSDRLTKARAIPVLAHEIGEHHGLRNVIGAGGWSALKKRIAVMARNKGSLTEGIWKGVLANYSEFDGWTDEQAAQSDKFIHEVIAKLGESDAGRKTSAWRDVVIWVRKFLLNTFGITTGINEEVVSNLVNGSLKRIMGGDGPRGGGRSIDGDFVMASNGVSNNSLDPGDETVNMDDTPIPTGDDYEFSEAQSIFLSSFPETTWTYSSTSATARLARSISDSARAGLDMDPGAARTVLRNLGPFTGFGTKAKIIKGVSGEEELFIQVFGKEQVEAGLDSAPALTMTVDKNGEFSIYGPPSNSYLYKQFARRGWAEPTRDADGNLHETLDGGFWTKLTGATYSQSIQLLGDAHARTLEWLGKEHTGLHWKRTTGSTGNKLGRESAIYFSKAFNPADYLTSPDARSKIFDKVADLFKQQGSFNWWHKTVGSQFHKAKIDADFGKVYNLAQQYIDDISRYATEAADMAPDLLPKLDRISDAIKGFTHWNRDSKDSKAISEAIFTGTLEDEKVYSSEELAERFGLDDRQIGLYHQFRNSVNRSMDDLAKSEMTKLAKTAKLEKALPELSLEETASFYTNQLDSVIQEAQEAKAMAQRLHADQLASLDAMQDIDTYNAIRDALKSKQSADMKVLDDALDDVIGLRNGFTQRADNVAKMKREGYAPLMRFGKYTIDVVEVDDEGNEVNYPATAGELAGQPIRHFFGMFESKSEALEAEREFREEFPTAKVTMGIASQESHTLFSGINPGTLEMLAQIVGEEDAVMQRYMKMATASRSAMKRLIHRKKIAGHSDDVVRTLSSFLVSNARAASANINFGDLLKAANDIPKTKGDVKDEAAKLINYIRNPGEEAAGLRGLLFMQYIGGSIASAAVNLTQSVTTTYPFLHQFGGTVKDIVSAGKLAGGKAFSGEFNIPENAQLQRAIKLAQEEGVVDPHNIHALMGDSVRPGMMQNRFMRNFIHVWGSAFGLAESFNRETAFIAAFNIAKRNGKDEDASYQFAKNAVAETQFVFSKAARPNWSRGAIGATLFTFKQFSVFYLEMFKRLPNKERAIMLATMIVLAGIGGIPGADDLDDLIDTIGQAMDYDTNSKRWKQEYARDVLGEYGAEFLLDGVSSFLPIDLRRLGMGNLVPGSAVFKRSESDRSRDALEFFGAAGSQVKAVFDAFDYAVNGQIGKAFTQAVAPTAVKNLVKGIEMASSGMYTDTRGRRVADVSLGESVMKGLGFQPTSVSNIQQAKGILMQDANLSRSVSSALAEMWAQGIFERDAEKSKKAREMIKTWNEKNPDTPIRVKMGSVQQRVRQMQITAADRMKKSMPKAMKSRAMEAFRE